MSQANKNIKIIDSKRRTMAKIDKKQLPLHLLNTDV